MAGYTRILSIDGGGIRGIIPGQVLVSLEKKLQQVAGDSEVRICDYFDLIAGTSTGGILTCAFLCPDLPDNPGRPKFTAEEAVELYLDRGGQIFEVSIWQAIESLGGLAEEKYSARALNRALKDYFGDVRLSQLLKPCLITAYDTTNRCAKFFTQHDIVSENLDDFLVRDVARATSAAPTYFEPARTRPLNDGAFSLIDGGVFANNPALCAYAEVRAKLSRASAQNMVLLSLGTGYAKKKYPYHTIKKWGQLEWIKPLIDIMMSGVAETVDYQLQQIFDSVDRPGQYLRINSDLRQASPDMDNASKDNLKKLKAEGERIARDFDQALNDFIPLLLEE